MIAARTVGRISAVSVAMTDAPIVVMHVINVVATIVITAATPVAGTVRIAGAPSIRTSVRNDAICIGCAT